MSIISEKFNLKIDAMKRDFDVNKGVEHQGIKGVLNEGEIFSLIREVIPQKYKLSKGIIENCKGNQSNETDIFIYDDEIIPPYIKNELAFVPVEAVKYIFEVKSFLNSNELKTTIDKFKKYKSIGGKSPTVLFSYASDIKGSELSRYKKNENNFFLYPEITVFCTSNKSYYYKSVEEYYIKDYFSQEKFLEEYAKVSNFDINGVVAEFSKHMENDTYLKTLPRSVFAKLIQASITVDEAMRDIKN